MYDYSDAERENDPFALPNLEIFEIGAWNVADFVDFSDSEGEIEPGIYYWYCFPGTMPDSDMFGPFLTYDEALADARGEMS